MEGLESPLIPRLMHAEVYVSSEEPDGHIPIIEFHNDLNRFPLLHVRFLQTT